jgi:hypothetical protein
MKNPPRDRIDGDAIVYCDHCCQPGRRPPGHMAPHAWFYLESTNRTPGEEKSTYVVWACSDECAREIWKRGPGPRVIDEEDGTIVVGSSSRDHR